VKDVEDEVGLVLGYTDRKDTEADKDLVPLHTDPRWEPLLERMTIFTAQQDAASG